MMRIKNMFVSLGLVAGFIASQPLCAEPSQVPIFLMSGSESLVMLNMSNDHELFFKAYDDYSDIDSDRPGGDKAVETTYKHSVNYYGYFESTTCYNYSSGVFVPQTANVASKYCNGVSGNWSGNFLNWATMTRIDAIRKVLYGGYRSIDLADRTVLERTFLPTDAHSFVKYYAGGDIGNLTPYSSAISMCNTTEETATRNSRDVTEPPIFRLAMGDYSMWTAHERVQCRWLEEYDTNNGNDSGVTGISANEHPPSEFAAGSEEFDVRVEVCKSDVLKESNCHRYPDGNLKPIGSLQEHGEDGSVKFGLMTGSYDRNKSGGVLRKNVSEFSDEVNEDNGILAAWPTGTPPGTGGIVDTLNRLRLTNYQYNSSSNYDRQRYNELDDCDFGQFGFDDGECSNWGNPQSEIYLETLRYFAGLNATPAFAAPDDDDYINGLGVESWVDPLTSDNFCAPVNVIHFNASTSSFDGNDLLGFGDLPDSDLPESDLDLDEFTDKVGEGEGVTNAGTYFIGQIPGSTDKACTPKDLDNLSDASGICPEAPWLEGTYKIAGLAYYANQNSIRTDLDDASGLEADIRVKTYAVALSPAQPIIRVPVPGDATREVILLPACMEYRDSGARHNGNCAIVDFRVVQPHEEVGNVGTGKFMVLWESAQFGGDYDQDMGGVIEYSIDSDASTITVTTEVYAASTGGIHGFGYVIAGTRDTDGLHIHSGHNNFDEYTDPYGLRDCDDAPDGNCDSDDGPSSETYTLGTSTATALETPLYYAAKWGGFKEKSAAELPDDMAPNNKPDEDYEWDADGNGLPDNYFFARNPGQLSEQLATVFNAIATVSSSASVVANSVSLETTTRIYQARFDSDGWTGKLLSFPVTVSTGALQDPEWDAGEVMAGQDFEDRVWLTWDGTGGVPFRWWDDNDTPADIADDTVIASNSLQTALKYHPDTGTDDGKGAERLNFLRGDRSNELALPGGIFRNRLGRKEVSGSVVEYWTPLGDVVHSTPTVVAAPAFSYSDTGYADFKIELGDSECFERDVDGNLVAVGSWNAGSGGAAGGREPMVYFGANDGALHGVSACTGEERLAYVPNAVYPGLSELTSTDYSHQYYVDGPATVVDAFWDSNSTWHTMLVGTLRGGGKAVFALDVTDPNTFDEDYAASIVRWEKTAADTGYSELGYTFSQPAVVKAKGHGWVAVFGNGYHGATENNEKAVLYIADIENGSLLATIDLSDPLVTGAVPAGGNGLSTVSPIDSDGDGEVDLIYAGDLKGNLWRFAATDSGFSAATTTLLYSAKSSTGLAQPITSRPAVGFHPTSAIGRMVYFGTGKYYEPDDQDPANAVQYNTMYGIWDRDTGTAIDSVATRNSAILQQQAITLQPPDASTFDCNPDAGAPACTPEDFYVRVLSNTPVRWTPDGTCAVDSSCGWYLDLTDTGEKMVATPILRGGRLIFVTTIPSLVPCEAGGSGWLMEIDPNTGGRLEMTVFDLNGDGVFDYYDDQATDTAGNAITPLPISGKKSKVGILQPPAILSGVGGTGDGSYGGAEGKYSSGTLDGQIDVTIENPGILAAGRKSWARIK